MRFLRVGPAGSERLAVLLDGGTAADVSGVVGDLTPSVLGEVGSAELPARISPELDSLPRIALDGQRVGPCIPRPSLIVGIGLNYEDHAREAGMPLPAEPVIFNKAPSSLAGPYDPLLLPPGATRVDWEVELGVVVGRRARYLDDEAAGLEAVAGYCVVNDVSERDHQLERGGQWAKGKSAETFCPTGPWLVTADEVGDPGDLELYCDVNGERMQAGSTRSMVFGVGYLLWYLSQYMVLEPGDLIATGTPAGVGFGQDPARYLHDGDVVEVGVTGLGAQRQVCTRAA